MNGTQVMEINTLFQLLSMKRANSPQLQIADRLLFTPDLFSFFLTGEANTEYTIASTSEMLNATTRTWDWPLIDRIGLPRHLFCPIVMPGTVRGQLRPDIAEETGLGRVDVIAVGSHDTASAVAAVPAKADECPVAFISSGTWSLLGVELDAPILTEEARRAQFTNEGGIGGKITFLQNITGLWFLQRLMAEWADEGDEQQYEPLLAAAERAEIQTVIPVDAPEFQNPKSMQQAIRGYCERQALDVPQTKADLTRVVLQSLPNTRRPHRRSTPCCPSPSRSSTSLVEAHKTNFSTASPNRRSASPWRPDPWRPPPSATSSRRRWPRARWPTSTK